jgi:hypothetical protein
MQLQRREHNAINLHCYQQYENTVPRLDFALHQSAHSISLTYKKKKKIQTLMKLKIYLVTQVLFFILF